MTLGTIGRALGMSLAIAAGGCGGGTTGGSPDLAHGGVDLAGADLAGVDLSAQVDLASPVDQAVAGDAAMAPDLTFVRDFAGDDLAGDSDVGGPCGGFTANPKMCLPWLVCVRNKIPDIPGMCERPDGA
jgi:hypothetical protein